MAELIADLSVIRRPGRSLRFGHTYREERPNQRIQLTAKMRRSFLALHFAVS